MAEDQDFDENEGFTVEEIVLELAKGALASGAYKENPSAAVVWAWAEGVQAWTAGRDLFVKLHGTPGDFTP